MEKIIFKEFGCEIIEKGGKKYVRYDSGGSASRMEEIEISNSEFEKFKLSEKDAYEVILKAQKRGNNNNKKSCR